MNQRNALLIREPVPVTHRTPSFVLHGFYQQSNGCDLPLRQAVDADAVVRRALIPAQQVIGGAQVQMRQSQQNLRAGRALAGFIAGYDRR